MFVDPPGELVGVTIFDAPDGTLVPVAFNATAVQVTAVPLVNPLTVIGEVAPVLLSNPQVAVYPVMTLPPSLAGAVKVTVALVFPPVAIPMVGAPGTVTGVMLFEAADASPVPMALTALTVKVYAVPLVSPMTEIDAHGATQLPTKLPGEDVAV